MAKNDLFPHRARVLEVLSICLKDKNDYLLEMSRRIYLKSLSPPLSVRATAGFRSEPAAAAGGVGVGGSFALREFFCRQKSKKSQILL